MTEDKRMVGIDKMTINDLYVLLNAIERAHGIVFAMWGKDDIKNIIETHKLDTERNGELLEELWSEDGQSALSEYLNSEHIIVPFILKYQHFKSTQISDGDDAMSAFLNS